MMEVEAAAVEDVVETWECGAEEDQPGDQERSEALDESTEVGERRRRVLAEEVVVEIVSHF